MATTPTPIPHASLPAIVRANVRAELARRNLDRRALVPVLNVGQSAVYRRFEEEDPVTLTLEEIDLLAGFLGVSTDDLTQRHGVL